MILFLIGFGIYCVVTLILVEIFVERHPNKFEE